MKFLLAWASFATLSVTAPINIININISQQTSHKSVTNNLKDIVPINLSGTVPLINMVEENYCLPASIDMVLSYFGHHVDQHEINTEIDGSVENAAFYINDTIERENLYSLREVPADFGLTNQERVMFEQYVSRSIQQNVPVILGYFDLPHQEDPGHVVVITSIRIDTQDSNETVYTINDPAGGFQRSFTGFDLSSLFVWRSLVIGAPNNFDFNKKEVSVNIPNQTDRSRLASGDYQSTNYQVNFSEAGIVSTKQLNQSSSINFSQLTLNENWNGKVQSYTGDTWNPANITGNQSWVEWGNWEYYHQYWLASCKLWWWDSTKVISDSIHNVVVTFRYYYKARMIASESTMDITLNYGSQIILSYQS